MESGLSSSSKGFMDIVEQPHVLAVDDSDIDRKLIEKLLKNFSCKGNMHCSLSVEAEDSFFTMFGLC